MSNRRRHTHEEQPSLQSRQHVDSLRTRLGDRFAEISDLPTEEFAFHDLPEQEFAACLAHERFRERAFCYRADVFFEAARINRLEIEERLKFQQQLELQEELDRLKKDCIPWLLLSPKEKSSRMRIGPEWLFSAPVVREMNQPWLSFLRNRSGRETLHVSVQWNQPNKILVQAFAELIKQMRETPGSLAYNTTVINTKGAKVSPQTGLAQLVVWRCKKAGMNTKEILRTLSRMRQALSLPAQKTLSKKLAWMAREAERTIAVSP